jgi:ABC-type glycerol-3-phosphate transport system permease component
LMARYSRWIVVVAAFAVLILTYVPLVYVLSNSLKSTPEYAAHPFSLIPSFQWSNYLEAWQGMARYLGNTVVVAAASIGIGIPAAAMGGYAFAQLQFRGKQFVFFAYLGLLMIPWTLTLIPLFEEVKSFSMFGTWWALILPYAAGSQPLLVFLFRVFFEGLPNDLFESARLDGCPESQILLRIVVPLSKPILLTGAILMSVNIWGDYLWPTVVLTDYHSFTVSAGLELYLGSFGMTGQGAGPGFAAFMLAMIPIIALVSGTMKYFVSGIASGAVKM